MPHRSSDIDAFRASATNLAVRFADVDMVGVVHHAAYIHWFEQIRFAFLQNIMGLDARTLIRERVAFPVVDCRAKYFHSVVFGEAVTGYCRLQQHRNSSFTFQFWIVKQDEAETLCAVGSTTHCYVDQSMQLLLRTPPLFAAALANASERFPGCFTDASDKEGWPL